MSLLDALLLDPWRDPREVHVALRADGASGCGIASDPCVGDGTGSIGSPGQPMKIRRNKKVIKLGTDPFFRLAPPHFP